MPARRYDTSKVQETVSAHDKEILLAFAQEQQPIYRFKIKGSANRDQHRFVGVNRIARNRPEMVETVTSRAERNQI